MISLQVIRAILSGKRPFDASAIHAAYRASKPDHLYRITRSEFSTLITLFGALSAYSEASRLPLSSEFALSETQRAILARAPAEQFERDWSDFVIELGSDQTSLGRRTADLDRYWLMRAHLSQGRTCHYDGETRDQEPGSGSMHASCDQPGSRLQMGSTHLVHAHEHYTALAQNHLDESVHYAYLRGLLNVYPFLPIAQANLANTLCRLVSNLRFHFEPRLNRLFWDILRTLAVDFTRAERQALLDALSRRLSFSLSRKHVFGTQSLIHADSDQDDWDPVLALRRAILDIPTSDEPWVRGQVHWVIVHGDWPLLVAIAGRPVIDNTVGRSPPFPRRINILLGLRYLELEENLVEGLWKDWMMVLGAEIRRADKIGTEKVDRAILLEFLKVSAIRKSDRVLTGIERLLLVESRIMLDQDKIQAAMTIKNPMESASVMLGAALVCIGTANLAMLFVRMRAAGFKVEDGRFPNTYLAQVVQVLLTFRELEAAWLITQQCEGELPVELVEALAKSCAKQGLLSQAVSLLSDTRISSDAKLDVSLKCLRQCSYRRVVLKRVDAVDICETLGSRMGHVPLGLRHAAVWMCLNAGLVRLAGLMGVCWNLSRRMQRKLVSRLVRAKLYKLALAVMDDRQGWSISGRSGWLASRVSDDEMDATRRVNILLSRVGRRRRKRLRGRAQLHATLTVIGRELRRSGRASPGRNRTAHRSTRHIDARLSFRPDAVTLNILCRALARCTSGMPSPRLRALFDRLSHAGLCGPTGNHFGTGKVDGQDKFVVALAALVGASDARVSFVRHTRPLLKSFLRGFVARGDEEAARVLEGLLEEADRTWRSGHATRI